MVCRTRTAPRLPEINPSYFSVLLGLSRERAPDCFDSGRTTARHADVDYQPDKSVHRTVIQRIYILRGSHSILMLDGGCGLKSPATCFEDSPTTIPNQKSRVEPVTGSTGLPLSIPCAGACVLNGPNRGLVDAVAIHKPVVEVQDILHSRTTSSPVNTTLEHAVRRLVSVGLRGLMVRIGLRAVNICVSPTPR